ncbi:NUDIX hydrolase [Chloroflexota bacterium]
MKIISRDVLIEGNHLRFVRKNAVTNAGKKVVWETIERVNVHGRGVVVIAALTEEKELILERNWRAPLESYILQLPAGLTDVADESEEEAARRELLEETGYQADELIPIVSVPVSPDITATRATHFFAPKVHFIGGENTDIGEEIEVIKVPIKKLDNFLLNPPRNTALDLRVPGMIWILQRKNLL